MGHPEKRLEAAGSALNGGDDQDVHVGLGFGSSCATNSNSCSLLAPTSDCAIPGSNIGFQMLKKCGWKEGSGLGVAEQGRLYPIETRVKNNKRGIGADSKAILTKKTKKSPPKESDLSKRAGKKSKRLRKLQEEEKRMREREFEREFFREFWPDNV